MKKNYITTRKHLRNCSININRVWTPKKMYCTDILYNSRAIPTVDCNYQETGHLWVKDNKAKSYWSKRAKNFINSNKCSKNSKLVFNDDKECFEFI